MNVPMARLSTFIGRIHSAKESLVLRLGLIWSAISQILKVEIPHYDRSGLLTQSAFFLFCWYFWLFWPAFTGRSLETGFAIGALGFAAVIMTVRADHLSRSEKVIWIAIGFLLFIAEVHVIDQDHIQQNEEHWAEMQRQDTRFQATMREFSDNSTIEKDHFHTLLQQDQAQFEGTIKALLATHRQDEREFAGIVQQQNKLIQSQQDMSEQFAGRLVPGDTPTPANPCDRFMHDSENPILPNTTTLLYPTNSAALTRTLASVITIGNAPVVSLERIDLNNPEIYLSIDFRDQKNRILVRVNKDGIVKNSDDLSVLRPNKSTLLIEDSFGQEFFRANFLNPHAFEISGKIVYCGKATEIKNLMPFSQGACTAYISGSVINIGMSKCPMPQP
jgi:hypothetical protein